MLRRPQKNEYRSTAQIKEAYEIEKELANRLRNATKEERRFLYSSLYDEFFKRVPLTPQLVHKLTPEIKKKHIDGRVRFLKPFLHKDSVFLEVGPGDCHLSYEAAKYVREVIAIDVSKEITKANEVPDNFRLIISDGASIPVPWNSVDIVFSDQLVEHLHPDDAIEQLRNIYNVLALNGVYICITPNRMTGPHDISKYFDEIATGFHLKEYTYSELRKMLREVGFSRVHGYIEIKGRYFRIPSLLLVFIESILSRLSFSMRQFITSQLPFRLLSNLLFLGKK